MYVNGEVAEIWVGPTPTKVAGVVEYSYDHEVSAVDDSELGQSFDAVTAGAEMWRASISIKASDTDPGQVLLALGAEVVCNFYDSGKQTGEVYRQGTGVVLKRPRKVQRNARQLIEVEIGARSALVELTEA